jgi:hypothetical protein
MLSLTQKAILRDCPHVSVSLWRVRLTLLLSKITGYAPCLTVLVSHDSDVLRSLDQSSGWLRGGVDVGAAGRVVGAGE